MFRPSLQNLNILQGPKCFKGNCLNACSGKHSWWQKSGQVASVYPAYRNVMIPTTMI